MVTLESSAVVRQGPCCQVVLVAQGFLMRYDTLRYGTVLIDKNNDSLFMIPVLDYLYFAVLLQSSLICSL